GKPLPSATPDLESERPGWLPPASAVIVVVLAEGSEKDPEAAERHGRRAIAKIFAGGFNAVLARPGDGWADPRDFADLAAEAAGSK
ncbi:MAG: hypothetical protein ACK4WC_10840, partial [Rubrimonas sp.]